MLPEQLRAVVAASRAAQGLPPVVQDPAALERAATAFRVMPADSSAPTRRTVRSGSRRGTAA